MTKQERVWAGIVGELDMWLPLDCPQRETRLINMTNSVCEKLHDQGVVIKVDRELPKNPYFRSDEDPRDRTPYSYDIKGQNGYNKCQKDMLKAGYVAVEPLIKGEK